MHTTTAPTAQQKLDILDGLIANGFSADAILAATYIAVRPDFTIDDLADYDADLDTDMAGALEELTEGGYVVEDADGALAIQPYEDL